MKKLSKIIATLLSVLLSVTAFAACGGDNKKDKKNTEKDIEISFWIGGFGEQFMDDIIAGFNSKYPDYNAYKTSERNAVTLVNSLKLGQNDTTDIYLNQTDAFINYQDMFMDLSEIANEKIDGEDKSIAEKYDSSLYKSLKYPDGSLKMLGWAGSIAGIMYNGDIIDGTAYSVPKTTEQLRRLTLRLKDDKRYNLNSFTPFVSFDNGGYYVYLVKAWMAQYAGLDYYQDNWLQLKNEAGEAPSKDVYLSENDGKKQALEVLTQIFRNDTLLYGSNSFVKDTAQTKFVQGNAAMMVNGTWMFNEAQASGSKSKNFKMMRTPVISAIIDKCTTIEDDEELAAVVTAVDNVLDNGAAVSLTGDGYDVNQADWDRIFAARKLIYHNGSEHALIVNKYTNAKEGVKKFIQYYYSDEGLAKFINATHAQANAYVTNGSSVNYSGWTDYEKQLYAESDRYTYVTDGNARSAMFANNVMRVYGTLNVVLDMSAGGDPKSATQLWSDFNSDVNKNWATWLKNAGY